MEKQHVEFSLIYPVESYFNVHFNWLVSATARGEAACYNLGKGFIYLCISFVFLIES